MSLLHNNNKYKNADKIKKYEESYINNNNNNNSIRVYLRANLTA
jgi:hypothetical protein